MKMTALCPFKPGNREKAQQVALAALKVCERRRTIKLRYQMVFTSSSPTFRTDVKVNKRALLLDCVEKHGEGNGTEFSLDHSFMT